MILVSKGRLEERSIKRRPPTRQPKRRILIVCEGEETERGYFEKFQHEVRNPRVHVQVARKTGEPLTVVTEAVRLKKEADAAAKAQKDENLRWDEVWSVFDVDEHAYFEKACRIAASGSIEIAVSNPCFELWALLHFREQRAHLERGKAHAALKRYMPGYEKILDFEKMHPAYDQAVQRAQALDKEAELHGAPGRNPTTGVYRVTESIKRPE